MLLIELFVFQCLFVLNKVWLFILSNMESDSALHGDVPDGAEMSPLEENPTESLEENGDNNGAIEESESAATEEDAGVLKMSKIAWSNFFLVWILWPTRVRMNNGTLLYQYCCTRRSYNSSSHRYGI